jgi:glycine/D-amino acid oxidase-like deaminating enzyme
MAASSDAVVIGAGIAGASTALALRRRGLDVTLIDAHEPGHARAASAGDHRILRASHGSDELYTRWSREARLRWLELGAEVGQELFVQSGAVMLATTRHTSWEDASRDTLARLGIPSFTVDVEELRIRLPLVDVRGLAYGLWEPESGFVFARRALQATVALFRQQGGALRRGVASTDEHEQPLLDGRPIGAGLVVLACGAWMGGLFPRTLGRLLDVVRQDVIMVDPPAGSTGYDADNFPAWIDHGYPAYGIPAAGGYGFKAVINWRGLTVNLDRDDRVVGQTSIARTRRYLAHRFPELARAPIVGQEVGQISNTTDTHFLIDRHPKHERVVLVAGDSGHLFKHGPVVGDHVAALALGEIDTEPRFSLGHRPVVAVTSADRPQ